MITKSEIAGLREKTSRNLFRVEGLQKVLGPAIGILIAIDEMLEEFQSLSNLQLEMLCGLCSEKGECEPTTDPSCTIQ